MRSTSQIQVHVPRFNKSRPSVICRKLPLVKYDILILAVYISTKIQWSGGSRDLEVSLEVPFLKPSIGVGTENMVLSTQRSATYHLLQGGNNIKYCTVAM